MEATINFIERRLENELHKEGEEIFQPFIHNYLYIVFVILLGFSDELKVDYLNSFFAAHSSGSHIALAQLEV